MPPLPPNPPAPPPAYSTPEFVVPSITVTRPERIVSRRNSNPFENLPEPTGKDRHIDGKQYDDDPRLDDTDWIEAIEERAAEDPQPATAHEAPAPPLQQQQQLAPPGPYRGAGEAYASPFKMDWHRGATLTELQKARSTAGKSRLQQWRETRMRSAQATPRGPEDAQYRYYQTPLPSDLSAMAWESPKSEVQLQTDDLLEQLR